MSPENRRKSSRKIGVRDRKQVCISSEVSLGHRWVPQMKVQAAPTTQAGGLREGVKGTKKVYSVCSGKNKGAAEQSCSLGAGTAT